MTEAVSIPSQLIIAGARFILVAPKEKRAIELDWQKNNYDAQSPRLLEHLKAGGNYGVLTHNGLCVIDVDNPEEFKNLNPKIPKTFMVSRGNSGRGHIYFFCPECPLAMTKKFETPFGDVRTGGNFYVVGPGSIHPDGDVYSVMDSSPVADISWSEISRLIGITPAARKKQEQYKAPDYIGENRNTTLHRLACSLASRNLSESSVLAAVRQENMGKCFPPLPDNEVKTLVHSAYQFVQTHPITPKTKTKRVGSDRKKPEYIFQPRGWYDKEGILYLTTINKTEQKMTFVYKDGKTLSTVGELPFKEPIMEDDGTVLVSGIKIVPREPIRNKDGEYIDIVGIPDTKAVMSGEDVDAPCLLKEIITHIGKYCDLSILDTRLCAYYIFMTWFYQKLTTLPYLRFRADTGKGKSRILRVVADLTMLPVFASGASSAAGIIRFQEYWHGSLIIDEADLKGESDDNGGYTNDLIKFLNLGFERGQYFIKADKVDPKKQEVFDPFSPKIIAMRGVFQDPATEGRCLSISPSETERTDVPAILPSVYYTEMRSIRSRLTRYVLMNWGILTDADPYPSFSDVDVEPRLKQLGSPLARVLAKVLPDGITEFKHYLDQRQKEIRIDRSMSFAGMLANTVYDWAVDPENPNNCVSIGDIKDRVGISANKISRGLKDSGFDIKPVMVSYRRNNDGTSITKRMTVKTVRVKDQRTWREICRRYILPKLEQSTFVSTTECDACPTSIRNDEYVDN